MSEATKTEKSDVGEGQSVSPLSLSLCDIKNSIRAAEDASKDISADKVVMLVDALGSMETFLERSDVQELYSKSNVKSGFEAHLRKAAENLQMEPDGEESLVPVIKIALASIASGLAVAGLFGLI